MKFGKYKSLLTIILLTASVFVVFNSLTSNVSGATTMTAWHTDNTITLDGDDSEADWAIADTLVLTNYGSGSRVDANITLKFLNDGTDLYFYAEWDDATENSNRKGWAWNATSSTYNNLGGNEDRFSLAWANSSTAMICGHGISGAYPVDTPADMLFDVWHWKATRGASAAGWADDKNWDSNGRNSDAKSSGGYTDNSVVAQAADKATITSLLGNSSAVSVFGAGDLPFWYDNGTEIAWVNGATTDNTPTSLLGYSVSQPVGSRGDVSTKGVYANGVWTLEGKRALVGDVADDITFEKGKSYDFWVAQMDNSGGTHAGDLAMKFTLAITGAAHPVTETSTVFSVDVSTQVTTVSETAATVTSTETETAAAVTSTETTTKTESGYSMLFVAFTMLSAISIAVLVRKR